MAKAKEKFDFVQPFKDIPKFFKGFPKNLVHLWKDPVKSSAEVVERKKEIFPFLYIGGCLLVLFLILTLIVPDLSFLLAIPALCILYCAFLLLILKKAGEKFGDIECNNCQTRIAYDDNVQIKVLNKSFKVTTSDKKIEKNGIPVEATISAKGKETTTVEVTCKCQACGTEKTFTHDFVTAEWEKSLVKVPYVQSGALLVTIEAEVRRRGEQGFEGEVPRTPTSGLKVSSGELEITYLRTPEDLVKGYFGDELQIR